MALSAEQGGAVRAALFYGCCSLAMNVLNKVVMSHFYFDYPIVMLIFQNALTLLLVELLRFSRLLTTPPYTFERGKMVLPASLMYAVHAYTSLNAVSQLSLPMYGAVKRCVPLATLVVSTLVLRKAAPTRAVALAVALITLGAVVASVYDSSFDAGSYGYGALSVLAQALYLTLVERLAAARGVGAVELLHVNAFNCLVVFLVADLIWDELRDAFLYLLTATLPIFWASFAATLVLGVALNLSVFACAARTSALTTTVVGNCKSVVQMFVGFYLGIWLFHDVDLAPLNVVGVLVNMLGSLLYAYAKYRQAQLPSAKGHASPAPLHASPLPSKSAEI